MPFESSHLRAPVGVPESNDTVRAGASQEAAIGRKGQSQDWAFVSPQFAQRAAVVGVPQLDDLLAGHGQHLGVRAEGQGPGQGDLLRKKPDEPTAFGVPQPQATVVPDGA